MDSDMWMSGLATAKRDYLNQQLQNSQLDRFDVDECEVEEEARPDFPSPFCYEDHDISSLCSHLEDEHPFETKVARQRRLRRVAISNSQALSLLGREFREAHLQVLLGSGTYRSSNTGAPSAAVDPLLSSIVLNFPHETEEASKSSFGNADDFFSKNTTLAKTRKLSIDLSLSKEEREQKRWQATMRANFVQNLLLLTLFGD